MQYVCYIGGRGRKGSLVVIQIALTSDPDKYLTHLKPTQPYDLELLGSEVGNEDVLEERRSKFKSALKNGWVKYTDELGLFVKALPKLDSKKGMKKVCVDWTAAEVAEIEFGVDRLGLKTKTKVIRRAVKFYLALVGYKARGWTIQAIKDGKFHAFHDLEHIENPEDL